MVEVQPLPLKMQGGCCGCLIQFPIQPPAFYPPAFYTHTIPITLYAANQNTKTLGGPTPNIKQTFLLENTTDQEQTVNFSSRTKIKTDIINYDGQTITLTEEPQTFKAETKTADIPTFAKDTGNADLPDLENFSNYTHTYKTGSRITFETEAGPAVYDWSDAKELNHEVLVYQENGINYIELIVSDITIEPHSTFTIDPAYGLDNEDNYDIRYDGEAYIPSLTEDGAIAMGDINGDTYPDLVVGSYQAGYNGGNSGSAFIIFGTSTVATGTQPLDIASNYNIRYDGASADDWLTSGGAIAIGDINGDGLSDLVLGASGADNNGSDSGSVWIIFTEKQPKYRLKGYMRIESYAEFR